MRIVWSLLLSCFTTCCMGQQIMSSEAVQRIRDHLPVMEPSITRDVVTDSTTVWYDRESMGVVYQIGAGGAADQEFVATGMLGISNAMFNISGDYPESQQSNGFGGNINALDAGSFPWSSLPGGTKRSSNSDNVKAFWLPKHADGAPWPVIIYRRELEGMFSPTPTVTGFDWCFPVGSVLLEVITVNQTQQHYVCEIRARIKHADSWAVEILRPFPTAESLERVVASLSHTEVKRLRLHDGFPGNRRFGTRRDSAFDVMAGVSELGPLPEDVVAELLDTTPFRSATGIEWGSGCSYPTTEAGFHLVPKHYDGAFVGNDSIGCANCHRSTQISARRHSPNNGKYGWLRGNREGILSWHPFEKPPNSTQVISRPRLRQTWVNAGYVAYYDKARHSAGMYKVLEGPLGRDQR